MSEQCNATFHPPTFTAPVTPPHACAREAGHPGNHWEIVPGVGRRWTDNANGSTPHQPTSSLEDEVMMADDLEVELRRDYVARIDELERQLRITQESNSHLRSVVNRLSEERDLAITQRHEARDERDHYKALHDVLSGYEKAVEQAHKLLGDALRF